MMRFKHLKTRIHFYLLSFLTTILLLVLLLVNRANMENASDQVLQDIRANGNILLSAVNEASSHLRVAARLLSSDYAFKQAYATHDHDTIVSAMGNHLRRLEQADVMLILDIDDGKLIADSSGRYPLGTHSPLDALLATAEEDDYLEAVGYQVINGALFQFVVVPLLVPDPQAWIATGFRIDDKYLQRFKELSSSDVSLYLDETGGRTLLASTFADGERDELTAWLSSSAEPASAQVVTMGGNNLLTHIRPLDQRAAVTAMLQRSLDQALSPYLQLQYSLIVVFAVAILFAYFGSSLLARNIASPVRTLAQFARRVERGEYGQQVAVNTQDEIGEMATAFNHMTRGLEEKEQVRTLLGKVVSPAIAKQLIDNGVKLGGEEKEVTVLFSDLRNFTSLCEGRGAGEILSLLNRYLDKMSAAVEANTGVVDKYIGDAMMALYGAPLASGQDGWNAVMTALQMKETLDEVNREFAECGLPQIDIGIGINTDTVVAGNMGSASRLNYTVIGDGVNLASRLEGLTKYYGVKILVAESTVARTPEITYRQIDKVRVKGKNEPVLIFEPYRSHGGEEIVVGLDLYNQAVENYQAGEWQTAYDRFAILHEHYPSQTLYGVYKERCQSLLANPPKGEWDGVFTFESK